MEIFDCSEADKNLETVIGQLKHILESSSAAHTKKHRPD